MSRILPLLVLCVSLMWSGDADPAALQGALDKWKAAWNEDVAKTLDLFHPESKMAKRLAKEGAKETYVKNNKNFKDQLGAITAIEAVKFSEKGKAWIVKVTYDKKGVVIGSFNVDKDAQGVWLFKAFNLTGNGEPEVNELQPPVKDDPPAEEPAK